MRTVEQKKKHAAYMADYYRRFPEKKAAWKKWFYRWRKTDIEYNRKFRKPLVDKFRGQRKEVEEYYLRVKCSPCLDCNRQFNPWVMQFDHRDTTTKLCEVSRLVKNGRTLKEVQDEILKCDLVCANCHAERTHKRRLNVRV